MSLKPLRSDFLAGIARKLREFAPYAVIELIMPGGSLLALALWLYRRQKKAQGFPASMDALH
jgi:hypothetical protein